MKDLAFRCIMHTVDQMEVKAHEELPAGESLDYFCKEMELIRNVLEALQTHGENSPLSTTFLGILTVVVNEPELGMNLLQAFNATMGKAMLDIAVEKFH